MTDEQKIRAYELALQTILFKCHKRKMLKNSPNLEEYWKGFVNNTLELAAILESVGDIAYAALNEADDGKEAA